MMQKQLIDGYQNAAKNAGGICVVPVGKVWSAVRKTDEHASLYQADGSHPSASGNYLAACSFYAAFYNTQVKKIDRGVPNAEILVKASALAKPAVPDFPLE